MIKFSYTIAFLLIAQLTIGQTVKVKNQQQRLKGENIDGFAVDVEGKKSDVQASLTRYLKEVGKVKFLSSDPLVITDATFGGNVYAKRPIYANEFGVRYNRERAQAQIDLTQQALDAVDKQSVRFINQGKDLTTKLANNELEKIRLEKALEANKLENLALKIRIENNKKAQDSIATAAVQIKKVKEVQLEKLRKIN